MPSFCGVDHVIIIGIDGLGGYYLQQEEKKGTLQTKMPVFYSLYKGTYKDNNSNNSAFHTLISTLEARSVYPSISGPAWASILTGNTPEANSIVNNEWPRDQHLCLPVSCPSSYDKSVPRTLFDLVDSNKINKNDNKNNIDYNNIINCKNKSYYCCLSWPWLSSLFNCNKSITVEVMQKNDSAVINKFAEYFPENNPIVSFLHIGDVDLAGHSDDWGSDIYFNACKQADKHIEKILTCVSSSSGNKESLIVICSDHGGSDKSHGKITATDIQCPLLIILNCNNNNNEKECKFQPVDIPDNNILPSSLYSVLDIVPTILYTLNISHIDKYLRGRTLLKYIG